MRFNFTTNSRLIVFALFISLLFLSGCLGGGSENGGGDPKTGGTLSVAVSPSSLSIKAGEKAKVTAEAACSSKDLFASACTIATATLSNNGNKLEIPLGYTIKVGEKKTFDIEVFSDSFMALEPFSYLHNSNPSTATAGWTQYSEVIATTDSKFVAFGDEVCVQNLTVSPQSQEVARGSTAVYTIFGGKAPYKVTSSIGTLPPNPSTVTTSGGTFSVAIALTTLATGATYAVADDAGKTVAATLTISPPAALSVLPALVKVSGVTGGQVKFDVRGGIPHYTIYTDNINYPPDTDMLLGEGSFRVNVPANSPKATVTYTVVDKALSEKKASLEIEVPNSQSLSAQSQTCTPVNNFSANISDYMPGTLKIVAGDQALEEKTVGTLSGAGSGTITKTDNGYAVSFSFTKAPAKGTPVNAYYLTKVKSLSNSPMDESLKITYGNLTLVQAGNYLVDGSGKTYGQISGKTITFTAPLGMNESQMIASYYGEPFNATGGVGVGKGDGKSRIFTLKTKYFPLQEGSLKVFTSNQPGDITFVNLLTGEFTVSFNTPPALGEDIKASYVLSKVNTVVNLDIDSFKFNIGLEVQK